MKNTVLFDFFGVISSEIAPFWFRRHFNDEESDRIKAEIVSLGDVGALTEEETYQRISERTNIPPEQIEKEWMELVVINEDLVSFVKEIRNKYPIYLLSNAIGPFLTRILQQYGLYDLFDKIYISSEMKIAKPDPAFYQYVLKDLGLEPADAVMIDDNPANIAGAAACGIDGILFSSNDAFRREFDAHFDGK